MTPLNSAILIYGISTSYLLKTIDSLVNDGYFVKVVNTEFDFYEEIKKSLFDAVFINLDVKPTDGITLINNLKFEKAINKPYSVIYSKNQDEFVQELAFNSGADGFINFYDKPTIMSWYVKNLLKRKKKSSEIIPKKNIEVDEEEYVIVFKNKKVQLPKKEFLIFKLLANSPEKFLTKKEIAVSIWNDETISNKRNIDVHIYNIRKLIKKDVIQSQKNKGYRINRRLLQ